MSSLRVTEIYPSIQGESRHAGRPCVFVRLTGCPLRCVWCDTAYAFTGGEQRSLDSIVAKAVSYGLELVEVTGGEPLAQKHTGKLLTLLADQFQEVLLETSGALSIEGLDPRVRVILDLKAPGSGEESRNRWQNLEQLKPGDELKIVIADRADYEWAKEVLQHRSIPEPVPVHFAPVHGELDPRTLAAWLIKDRLAARLQLQLHKYIWGPEVRGV
ncbi:MAG: radical SAM protein [Planctomycetota bacterium]